MAFAVVGLAWGCRSEGHTPTPRDSARWRQVQVWGAHQKAPGLSDNLTKAVERLAYAAGATAPRQAAFSAFRQWRKARGSLPQDVDNAQRLKRLAALLKFSETALASAIVGQDRERLDDIVYLAERLWVEGRSLADMMVGVAIIDRIVDVHDRLDVAPSLRATPIPRDIVFLAAAREALHRDTLDTGADPQRAHDHDSLKILAPLRDQPVELLKWAKGTYEDLDPGLMPDLGQPLSLLHPFDMLDQTRQAVDALTRGR